jgi:hypothetical protein
MNGIPMRVTLAAASIAAGVIHFLVTPDHFEEFALFGAFFLALGAFQVLWAGAVLAKPNTIVLLAGVLVSVAVIAIWIVSRTAGLPIGPEAGEPEAVGFLDILSTVLEALVVVVGTYLLITKPESERRPELHSLEREARAA